MSFVPIPGVKVYELNPVEVLLKQNGSRGFSRRQLCKALGAKKRTVMWHIYNSRFVEDTNPSLHGSGKTKISVYNYRTKDEPYWKPRVSAKKIKLNEN
jgi:hypothetical protein